MNTPAIPYSFKPENEHDMCALACLPQLVLPEATCIDASDKLAAWLDAARLAQACGAHRVALALGASVAGSAWLGIGPAAHLWLGRLARGMGPHPGLVLLLSPSMAGQCKQWLRAFDQQAWALKPRVVIPEGLKTECEAVLTELRLPWAVASLQPGFGQVALEWICSGVVMERGRLREHAYTDSLWPSIRCWLNDPLGHSEIGPHWSAGYHNMTPGSFIRPGPSGVMIDMPQGDAYSSAALVTQDMLYGSFDAQVHIEVANPGAGTTLELAAISVDAPRTRQTDRSQITARDTSLAFDVHGAPPYVCSECDEADGHRIAWNRAYTLTEDMPVSIAPPKTDKRSSNHYNRYGRDQGDKIPAAYKGWIRLIRVGHVFVSMFKPDLPEAQWKISGTVQHPGMPSGIFLRLAAKHWVKQPATVAPANQVTFSQFKVLVPAPKEVS